MNPSIPAAAAKLLDFISTFESSETSKGYETIYGNHQDKLPKPITAMTLDELMRAQVGWDAYSARRPLDATSSCRPPWPRSRRRCV